MRRKQYLLKHKEAIYTGMLLSGKLNAHLEETDRSANEMFELLTQQYAESEDITEKLKEQNQLAWAQRMNGLRQRVEETINTELIYQ